MDWLITAPPISLSAEPFLNEVAAQYIYVALLLLLYFFCLFLICLRLLVYKQWVNYKEICPNQVYVYHVRINFYWMQKR